MFTFLFALPFALEVELIAPSFQPIRWDEVKKKLCALENNIAFKQRFVLAGKDRAKAYANTHINRFRDFKKALTNPSATYLWAIRGGWGASYVVYQMRRDNIRLNGKIVCGFSDVTALHLLAAHEGVPSIHCAMPVFSSETTTTVNGQTSLKPIFSLLKNPNQTFAYTFEVIQAPQPKAHLSGSVLGGNLSLLHCYIGTPLALKGKDRFIFIEEVREPIFVKMRALVRSGGLKGAKALIFGSLDGDDKKMIREFLSAEKIDIPVLYSPEFGHGPVNHPLPFGTKANLMIEGAQAVLTVGMEPIAAEHMSNHHQTTHSTSLKDGIRVKLSTLLAQKGRFKGKGKNIFVILSDEFPKRLENYLLALYESGELKDAKSITFDTRGHAHLRGTIRKWADFLNITTICKIK